MDFWGRGSGRRVKTVRQPAELVGSRLIQRGVLYRRHRADEFGVSGFL